MNYIYTIILIFLALLTILNLIVGVSNDAVNFINSAIGSKVTSYRNILLISGLGIITGVAFSEGMMDVARNEILIPTFFSFKEIMIIMLSVMIINVILLDIYNTLALPTSTTVSLIFELIGASIGVRFFKTNGTDLNVAESLNIIKISDISLGILISIVCAFLLGVIVQFLIRMVFTFKSSQKQELYGPFLGGIIMTSIIYFTILRGLKFSIITSNSIYLFIDNHSNYLIIINLILWTSIFKIFSKKINTFRFVVIAGTFSLALAFAGNDLVNFIGPFITSMESYKMFKVAGSDNFILNFLSKPVKTPYVLLLASGIVMFITLFVSRKLKNVTSTEINLGRQNLGVEKFEGSVLSRYILNFIYFIRKNISKSIPVRYKGIINDKISKVYSGKSEIELGDVSFDLIRASVILFISIVLISFATSLKYPVSTTYITFMVAMGTALGDGAWNKLNALNRITGVLTVIAGWILTSFFAIILSLVLAIIIMWGKGWVISLISLVLILFLIRFYSVYGRKKTVTDKKIEPQKNVNPNITFYLKENTVNLLLEISKYYYLQTECIINSDSERCQTLNTSFKVFNENAKNKHLQLNDVMLNQNNISEEIKDLYLQSANQHFQVLSVLNYTINSALEFTQNDKEVNTLQKADLVILSEEFSNFVNYASHYLKTSQFFEFENLDNHFNILNNQIDKFRKKTLKQIKKQEISTKNSFIFLQILSSTESLLVNLNKAILLDFKIQRS